MAENYLLASEVINGQEAQVKLTLPGESQAFVLFQVKSLEAVFEKDKIDVKTIGSRVTQKKAVGWTGTGTMTAYYVSSRFRQIALDYINKGIDIYARMDIMNNDASAASELGYQITALTQVNFDSSVMAKVDVESQALEEDIPFTFGGAEISSVFKAPSYIPDALPPAPLS